MWRRYVFESRVNQEMQKRRGPHIVICAGKEKRKERNIIWYLVAPPKNLLAPLLQALRDLMNDLLG